MVEEIKIKKKIAKRGDDGYKIVSIRMMKELLESLLDKYQLIFEETKN